jgi:polynucleotide 5'-kinase involved in rRNA processing
VISDPRKNMLLDLKNESHEDQVSDFTLVLDDKSKIKVGDLPEGATIFAIKEYQKYSEAEEQFCLPGDAELGIRNVSTSIDSRKSIFKLNRSWKDSIQGIVQSVSDNKAEIILINGVQNAGKSTFASCLVNQLLSKSQKEVYFMDLDPGQPNYNLAG